MESTTKKVILPTKGICNATPPQICNDTELLDAEGITYINNAIRPIQDTAKVLDAGYHSGRLLFAHTLNNGDKLYLTYEDDTQNINVYEEDGSYYTEIRVSHEVYSISSIGNTIILNTKDGLYYYLWRMSDKKYILLGNKIPEPDVTITLQTQNGASGDMRVLEDFKYSEWAEFHTYDSGTTAFQIQDGDNFQTASNAIIGSYASLKTKVAEQNGFALPFFVRIALQLYDGSYVLPGAPILLCPSTLENFHIWQSPSDDEYLRTEMYYFKLMYKNNTDFDGWEDVVKKISFFVSEGVNIYELDQIYHSINSGSSSHLNQYVYSAGTYWSAIGDSWFRRSSTLCINEILVKRDKDAIKDDICTSSVFYHIADIGLSTNSTSQYLSIKPHTLKNLTTQETLVNSTNGDDYYSHCAIISGFNKTYTFNRRLNVIDVKRKCFEGFKEFGPFVNTTVSNTIYVFIKTNNGTRIVKSNGAFGKFAKCSWFYYPDPRAYKAIINGYTIELTEHTDLNGAYYFGGMPEYVDDDAPLSGSDTASESSDLWEYLNNYLLQSNVDNPFTFFASGYVRVGQGKIIGMAALTTALSQDAYKISTTLVFTTQGIWALKINDEGQYTSVAPPFSREVAIKDADICMIDNGVFFVSEKGLMLITDDGIQCVSEQLNGRNPYEHEIAIGCVYKNFKDFIKTCSMAYDYRDSQLWLINTNYDYHWVYNIKTGTFSRMNDGKKYISVCSDYPDTLLQTKVTDTNCPIYSMKDKPDINSDTHEYSTWFITRPMKFEESVKLKTIRELKNIYESVTGDMEVSVVIYASNDTYSWTKISSLGGRGFKYFIFKVVFEDMKAVDSFSGSIIGYDTRNTDKLR